MRGVWGMGYGVWVIGGEGFFAEVERGGFLVNFTFFIG